jgi:hypothetical protein
MPQSLVNNNLHLIYSTRERRPTISAAIQPKLFGYLAGVVKNIGGNPIAPVAVPASPQRTKNLIRRFAFYSLSAKIAYIIPRTGADKRG